MCWVKLNVFHLEVSLKGLAQKFGNISSNKDNIGTFVQILQEMRYHIGYGLVSYLIQVITKTSVFHANILIYLVCFVIVLHVFLLDIKIKSINNTVNEETKTIWKKLGLNLFFQK